MFFLLKYDLRSHRGAVLILGGIMLNVWAAALLFQPVEQHLVKKYKEVEEDEDVVPQVGFGFCAGQGGGFCFHNKCVIFGGPTFVVCSSLQVQRYMLQKCSCLSLFHVER